jgi:hypothetical protein
MRITPVKQSRKILYLAENAHRQAVAVILKPLFHGISITCQAIKAENTAAGAAMA